MVFDKNKYKFMSETERLKIKIGNHNKHNNKTKSEKNSSLYKEYMFSSPFKKIIKNKKASYINLSQENKKNNNNYKSTNNNTKKNNSIQKLKYNKSFELNMNNNLLPNNNFDIINDNLYTLNYNKHKGSKNFNNNSVILNNKPKKVKKKNKTLVKSNINHGNSSFKKSEANYENMIIKKLDDKFLYLEHNIIDKKYENDIDHDEMIITSKKKPVNNGKKNSGNQNSNKLSNIIGFNSNPKEINEDEYFNISENKNNIEIDENYLLNTSFENQRSDFGIMYTDNYDKTVMDDLLSLEIKLMVEKMLDMQKSYHKELNFILGQYNNNNKIFKILVKKIRFFQKKIHVLRGLEEKRNLEGNIYNFVGIYHNNNKHEINKINKNEFNIWKNNIIKINKKSNIFDKEKLRQIFEIIVFDKYNKISGKLESIENKIILGLMKKLKYNSKKNDEIKSNYYSSVKTTYNNKLNKIKQNKNTSTSPIHTYKNSVQKNKIDIPSSINKKKHKKISSCDNPKQPKYNIKYMKQKYW